MWARQTIKGALAVLACSLLARPTLAQDRLTDQLVDWSLSQPQWREDHDALKAFLEAAITQAVPRGPVPAPFSPAGLDPHRFSLPLRDSLAILPAPGTTTGIVAGLADTYRHFYPLGASCETGSLSLPASLEEAAGQIARLAGRTVALHQGAFSYEQAVFLRTHHARVIQLIEEAPFGGAIGEQDTPIVLEYLDILDKAGQEPVFCAALTWGLLLERSWQERIHSLMANHARANEAVISSFQTAYGVIRFGGNADSSTLSGNLLFNADLGGNDIYGLRTVDHWSGLPQMLIDFAGADTYESLEPGGYAAGIGSPSFLVDHSGNDTYSAQVQTQGFGLYGIGLLLDLGGDDEYYARSMAQGAALFGAGMLVDIGGDDRYQAAGLAQGVGMTAGTGTLTDSTGNDTYLSTGLTPTSYGTPGLSDSWSQGVGVGLRFIAPGGIGILRDGAGSDRYSSGSFGQGGGYFFGMGFFHDAGRQADAYLGARYNFGWGAHMGMAYFLEEGGNDHYRTRQIVSAGLAWDYSLVLFEDLGGDDLYEVGDFSLAASAYHSIVIFHDFGGSDTYRQIAPGKAEEGAPNLSLFLDTGEGENRFDAGSPGSNCRLRARLGLVIVESAPDPASMLCTPE